VGDASASGLGTLATGSLTAASIGAADGCGVTETTNAVSVLPGTPGTGVMVTAKAGEPCGVTEATGGALVSIADTLLRHEPDQYDPIQVVWVITEAWTISEVTATLPSKSGRPTFGLTTHQILPWFMCDSPQCNQGDQM
jgi:hypothetical protein